MGNRDAVLFVFAIGAEGVALHKRQLRKRLAQLLSVRAAGFQSGQGRGLAHWSECPMPSAGSPTHSRAIEIRPSRGLLHSS